MYQLVNYIISTAHKKYKVQLEVNYFSKWRFFHVPTGGYKLALTKGSPAPTGLVKYFTFRFFYFFSGPETQGTYKDTNDDLYSILITIVIFSSQ